MKIDYSLNVENLESKLTRFWELSAKKIRLLEREYDPAQGSPVFTVRGKYTTRGWTEWTQGFQFGSAILQFDATGEREFLELGKEKILRYMAPHLSHTGVHDHGFNTISTYGNLFRLMAEGKIPYNPDEKGLYELAVKVSGAVQASRWTALPEGGYIYSFNGPHSLFVDTLRTCRVLIVSSLLGHYLLGENDERIDLFQRARVHGRSTAKYNIYYGEGRDIYDVRGRTAHEAIFNVKNGSFRCPSSQQGYSPFTTWTRGLAWAMLGFAELLEAIDALPEEKVRGLDDISETVDAFTRAGRATCDFYIDHSTADGIPFWDTGAPGLHRLGDYSKSPAEPYNDVEPLDSSAAVIAAQGLLRLGHFLKTRNDPENGNRYWQAGLTVLHTLLDEPFLSTEESHQGLILHSIYHRPNGWDYVPEESKIPCGESSMWGDYHAREVALYLQRIIHGEPYYTFFNGVPLA